MPNNSKTVKNTVKKRVTITPAMRAAHENRNRALDNTDARTLPPEVWAKSITRAEFEASLAKKHGAKKLTSVRLDADVLDWLKSKGAGHISRVNKILRAAMLADQRRS